MDLDDMSESKCCCTALSFIRSQMMMPQLSMFDTRAKLEICSSPFIYFFLGSNSPCHRMCCGPDTLLWSASSAFWIADMVGIDGHVSSVFPLLISFCWRKLTCSSMPTISATRKTHEAKHRRVPQHILRQGKLLRHGMMYDTMRPT